jgi:hypothetical protein
MDMPIPKCIKKVTLTNLMPYKLFENEHCSVRICYFVLFYIFLQHYRH